ncbi:DNA pilot protein [Microviridae sp.]|nr:DNA pilot protein [Microviridae sp.]
MGLAPIVTSALISGGSSLIGGLLGRKKSKSAAQTLAEQRAHEEQRYTWLRDGAQKAGFNPLTVLGAAGHTAGMTSPSTESPLGWKASLGNALNQAGQVLASYDPVAEEGRQLDNELKQRQITAFDAEKNQQGSQPHPLVEGGTQGASAAAEDRFPHLSADPKENSQDSRVDLGSDRIEDHRLGGSSLWPNQYVVRNPLNPTETYVMPKTWTPAEGVEGLIGDLGGEGNSMSALFKLGKDTLLNQGGLEKVSYDVTTGQVHRIHTDQEKKTWITPHGQQPAGAPKPSITLLPITEADRLEGVTKR